MESQFQIQHKTHKKIPTLPHFQCNLNQIFSAIAIKTPASNYCDAEICFWQNCFTVKSTLTHTHTQNHFKSFFISNANGFIIKKISHRGGKKT